MLPFAQLAAESINHRAIAVEALTRMGKGERPPFTSDKAVPCYQCNASPKGYPLGFPDVILLDISNLPGRVLIQHSCGHRSECALGLRQNIRLNSTTLTSTEAKIQHFIASQTTSVFQKLRLCHFHNPPEGYCSPEKMIALGLFSLGAPFTPNYNTIPTTYMLEQMAQKEPICVWVHQHVAEAAALTEPPSQQLDDVQWYQHRNVFFLPPGTLQVDGHDCPFLAYAVVETGSYTLLDIKDAYRNIGKRLLVWTVSPANHATYTWEVLLSGNLTDHTYESNREHSEFMKRATKLILVLNTLGMTPHATAQRIECIKTKPLSKQSRRKGRKGEHKTYTCPWLKFTRNPALNRKYKNTGRTMPPHNKPGWFQRIRTKMGFKWIYRPPHRANAHLDPE